MIKFLIFYMLYFLMILACFLSIYAEAKPLSKQILTKYNTLKVVTDCNYIVTSGWRSKVHNKAVGGVPNSMHMIGLALDLIPLESCIRSIGAISVIASGIFNGVILYPTHIHVDMGNRKYYYKAR